MSDAPVNSRWLTAAALGIGAVAWLLAHPYQGIFHDANLYTLQALARLYPVSLSQDVFLKFGSQDRFTLFSPIYAATIRLVGLDHAAALLTLFSQGALVAAAAFLARAILPRWASLWAIAGVLALPLYYGPDRIFAGLEDFLTPRMLAESLVLAALTAALNGRKRLGLCVLVAALSLHPVMAAAGATAFAALFLDRLPERRGLILPALIFPGVFLAAYAMPWGMGGRFDATWLTLVTHRSPYLFLSDWELDDWARAGVMATTLLLGTIALTGRAQIVSRMALFCVLGGWLLTLVGCDGLHLVLITQLQPWRWQWLGTLIAVLLLPMVVFTFWSRGTSGRATALLLLSSWIFGVDEYALITCVLCLASLLSARLKPAEIRLIGLGAWAVIAVAAIWRVASDLVFTDVHYLNATLPLWLRRACSVARDGTWGILLLGVLALFRKAVGRTTSQICLAATVVVTLILVPYSWRAWSESEFGNRSQEFASWRALIPPGTDVLWPESPVSAWALLERGNYLSGLQTSGLVYSRTAALELRRRAESLNSQIATATFLEWGDIGSNLSLSLAELKGVCGLGVVNFLVTSADLGFAPLAELASDSSNHAHPLKLYHCQAQARAAAAAT
jgi:hypothetical protein